mgnify:CR=1 FL=1
MRKFIAAAMVAVSMMGLAACTQAERASYNSSKDADNFKVDRRLVVINTISGEPTLELTGRFSIHEDRSEGLNQLEITAKLEDGSVKKHLVGLPPTVAYTVEDVHGSDVSTSRYQISYLPESIIPVTFKNGE